MNRFFERVFCINLGFKSDRLASFMGRVPKCLGEIEVFRAIHGDTVKHPKWWTAGNGAWGCLRSHLAILERCYNEGVESYLVMEDDCLWKPDFEERLEEFMQSLDPSWQQVYLGGQLQHSEKNPPIKINDNCYRASNVNRTHCFGLHRRGYEQVYKHWNDYPFANGFHCDHQIGLLHETGKFNVFVPSKWLVGQDGGPSNISGNHNGATFWTDPEKCSINASKWQDRPVVPVFLEASVEVAIQLERRGWHRGKWQNEDRLDRGICMALGSVDVRGGLLSWYKAVMPEAVREGNSCICLHHPNLSWACVSSLEFAKFHRIVAETAEQAEEQLNAIHEAQEPAPAPIRRRNLIYHIWPRKGNGVWQWNVSELLKRIEQFDGVRSIGIATSDNADSVETVQAMFAGTRIDNWIVATNNPDLGEVVTFPKLLLTVPEDDSITFYGHAKGVKYDDPKYTRDWTEMCYEVCLDDPVYVDASMEHYPVSGPFACTGEKWPEQKNGWHYAGSFYWFSNVAVHKKENWRDVLPIYWGSELWLPNLFKRSEAGALFGHECGWMYGSGEISRMRAWMDEWRKSKRKFVDRPPSISIVIPTIGRPGLPSLIESIKRQMNPDDELIVVADGQEARSRVSEAPGVIYATHSHPQSELGHAQRNHGRTIAKGDLIWYVDDDDSVASDALSSIRREMRGIRQPTIFRMKHLGQVIWSDRETRTGNVSGQMLVIPNLESIPLWAVPCEDAPRGDAEWIRRVEQSTGLRWSDDVIYEISGHSQGKL